MVYLGVKKPENIETFEQAVKRLELRDIDIFNKEKEFLHKSIFYAFFMVLMLSASIYNFIVGHIYSGVMFSMMSILMFSFF